MYRGVMVESVRWAKRGRMPGFFCRRDAIWCLMKCRFLRVGAGARVSRPAPPPWPPPASRRAARSLPPRRSPPSARSDREPGGPAAREPGGRGAAAPVPGLPRPRSLEPRPLARPSPGQRRGRAGNRLAPYKPGGRAAPAPPPARSGCAPPRTTPAPAGGNARAPGRFPGLRTTAVTGCRSIRPDPASE